MHVWQAESQIGCGFEEDVCAVEWARSADQRAGARAEPAVLTLSEGFSSEVAGRLAVRRWWNPVVQTQASISRGGLNVVQNEMI